MMVMGKKNPGLYMGNSVYPFYINRIFPVHQYHKTVQNGWKGLFTKKGQVSNQNRKIGNIDSTCIDADFKFRGGKRKGGIHIRPIRGDRTQITEKHAGMYT